MNASIADRTTVHGVEIRAVGGSTSRTVPLAAICFAALGALVSGLLLKQHVESDWTSCVVGSMMGCGGVVSTEFGYAFGLPLPVFLLPYYIGLLLLFAHAGFGPRASRASLTTPLRVLATGALIPSLGLLVVSAAVLERFCPMCLMLDAFNLGLFVCARRLEAPRAMSRWTWPTNARVVVFALAVTVNLMAAGAVWATRDGRPVEASGGDARHGRSMAIDVRTTARLTAVLSPTCPHCAELWKTLPDLVEALGRNGHPFALEVDLLPDSQRCFGELGVPTLERGISRAACRATVHAVCARAQGRLRPYLDAFFERVRDNVVEGLGHHAFTRIWRDAGLDFDAMKSCTGDRQGAWDVSDASDTARSTLREHLLSQGPRLHDPDFAFPTLYVDGRRVDRGSERGVEHLRAALIEHWRAVSDATNP